MRGAVNKGRSQQAAQVIILRLRLLADPAPVEPDDAVDLLAALLLGAEVSFGMEEWRRFVDLGGARDVEGLDFEVPVDAVALASWESEGGEEESLKS